MLKTSYLGLTLENPLVASSSSLTSSVERIKKLEEAGAGAVVLKSLFEEQIASDSRLDDYYIHPESGNYMFEYTRSHAIEHYAALIRDTKRECSIPVIASINCTTDGEWTAFARRIEEAGADALEANIYFLPTDATRDGRVYEERYLKIADKICRQVKIPVAVKLTPYFTNPLEVIGQLSFRGVKGVVLFNRLYRPDIDIEAMEFTSSGVFSTPDDLALSLRWTALASPQVKTLDYGISNGVHSGADLIKAILVGASVVEVCSEIYQSGTPAIGKMLDEAREWLKRKGYHTLDRVRGLMSTADSDNYEVFERTQFIKYYPSAR